MSDGFVKIYGHKLLRSTLWDESAHVRIAFIGMLAEADMSGLVQVPTEKGLARVLNLSAAETRSALDVLESPDANSKSSEEEGRRVLRVPGGWQIVNYTKYREFRSKKQEDDRLRKRDERDVQKADAARTSPDMSSGVRDESISNGKSRLEDRSQISDLREEEREAPSPCPGPSAEDGLTVVASDLVSENDSRPDDTADPLLTVRHFYAELLGEIASFPNHSKGTIDAYKGLADFARKTPNPRRTLTALFMAFREDEYAAERRYPLALLNEQSSQFLSTGLGLLEVFEQQKAAAQ